MLDRLTGLEVFARVAGAGSLSAAARALGMSQTMVTKHIAALEGRLGVKLFHRTTRRLSITEAGRNYLESSARILADIEAADAAVAADRVEPRGLLRLNAPVSFGTRQIAPLLAECAAPSYLEARGTPRTVASLADHNCLGYTLSQRTPIDRWVFGAGADFSVQISGNLRANNGDALRAAAIAGQGIIHQPTFIVADDLRAGRLVALTLDQPNVELGGIYGVFLPDRHPPARVRAFIDFIADRFAPQPPWDRELASPRGRGRATG